FRVSPTANGMRRRSCLGRTVEERRAEGAVRPSNAPCRHGRPEWLRSVDPQLLKFVPQRPEGDAQLRGGLGLVEAVVLQRLLDGLALDFLDEAGQGAGGG